VGDVPRVVPHSDEGWGGAWGQRGGQAMRRGPGDEDINTLTTIIPSVEILDPIT
jgi:hypothetical protein